MSKIRIPLILLLLLLTLAGCAGQEELPEEQLTSLAQLSEQGMKIGVPTGAKSDEVAREQFPDAEIVQYRNIGEGFIALKTGKLDAFCFTKNIMQYVVNQNPDLTLIDESVALNDMAIGVRLDDTALMAEINGVIKTFNETGVRAELEAKWLGGVIYPELPEPAANPSRTLVVGIPDENPPMSYTDADGNITGFDAEYALRLGSALNAEIDFRVMEWPAIIPSLQSGRVDMIIANLNITEERRQSMLLSDVYVTTDIVMMVRNTVSGAPAVFRPEDWAGSKIAAITGTVTDKMIEEHIPGAEPVYFNNAADGIEALKNGRIDAIIDDDALLRFYIAENPELRMLEPFVVETDFGVVVSKDNPALLSELNEFIALIKSDGTYDDMLDRWLHAAGPAVMPEIAAGGGQTLNFGTSGAADGFSFFSHGELMGFDIEFAKRFAAFTDRALDISVMDFGGLLPSVLSGKIDFAASLFTITEERRQSVDFTDPYYTGGMALVTMKPESANVFRPEDFAGKNFAIITGTIWDTLLASSMPDANPVHFNSLPETVMALRQGRVDATFTGAALAKRFGFLYPDLELLYPPVFETDTAFIFGKENPALRESFNVFLREIRANGVYADMEERWLNTVDTPDMPQITGTGENGKLIFATMGTIDIFSFVQNGEPAGFEIELVYRFARHAGMEVEIQLMDFAGIIPAVRSGKVDFAGSSISITEERKESVDFSDPIYVEGLLVAVRKDVVLASPGFWEKLKTDFGRNLILEDRWKLIVDGLRVSMIITIFAFALATLLGFGVCGLRMSKNPILQAAGKLYVTLLRGTPIVVLLMITFYVIFAKSSISAVTVAVIAFGTNGAAFIGEIIRSAILTIDRGQVEAARSMGFSKTGAFFTVTFPQAARVAFPVYMSEFISLFKMTSVVGYIAVVDLTKAGDIIRSRTYDAFFPLIIVALAYLAAASAMIWLFNLINRATDKRYKLNKRRSKLAVSARGAGVGAAAAIIGVEVKEGEMQ